ncbi:MAG TPA: hypothetical protein VK615_05915 [Candidatus Binatia bacterium]|nr:hypothetical protein [Candidatus Binatia bacterium]
MSLFHKLFRALRGPRCPVTPDEKAWVEKRLLWLREEFGPESIRRPPLDPTSQLLPRSWDGSVKAAFDLFDRLCDFMRVDPARLQLDFYSQSESHDVDSAYAGELHSSGPAGLFIHPQDNQRLVIAIERSGLSRPAALAATICHELGHVHLLADRRIARDCEDSEPLTDLLTVFFGVGIFTANSAFQFHQWQDHSHQGWSTSRLGYLSEEIFGYALACYSWYRGELKPSWARHLRENVHYYFDDSLHFLSKTHDTLVPFNGDQQGQQELTLG